MCSIRAPFSYLAISVVCCEVVGCLEKSSVLAKC